MDFGLGGKVAIVTGGGGGIGAAYGRALGEAGASVALADVNEEAAQAAAAELERDGIRAIAVRVDVTDQDSADELAARTVAELGGIDILVNNAGLMAGMPQENLLDYPLDAWNRMIAVNVTGALLCTRACVPSMTERGGGKIINQSSGGAWLNGRPYGITKLALVSLTFGLARDLGDRNICVNAIAPGAIETDAALSMFPADSAWRENMKQLMAIKKAAQPSDLFGALLFLASPASDWVTGQCINVDGGWIMRF